MNNKTFECTVGIWHEYETSILVTYSELKELSKGVKAYNMKDYLDDRKSTNFYSFKFCPFCGKKIDCDGYRKINNK